ncbi:hypothetical protein [Nocardia terpenica]|uniref:Uncharacterized protein n=1 Tax=Nocardia terpenica TaxID=455432 RepID=A0A6G9Z9K9_9NOCA|nr:hypothetical protein [Nocardia terpenica]QIS22162.1 hypothetical protein F6W96_31275 [Nocardia terpenica]
MSKYTVVIVRGEQHGGVDRCPRLTMYIDTSAPNPRVTGVSVSSGGADGLTAGNLPDIDLPTIVEALISRVSASNMHSQLKLFEGSVDNSDETKKAARSSSERAEPDAGSVAGVRAATPSLLESPGSEGPSAGRAYRKMPDPDELRENLRKIGTVTGLAKYYQVPRHTAQGWVGRLKKLNSTDASVMPVSE